MFAPGAAGLLLDDENGAAPGAPVWPGAPAKSGGPPECWTMAGSLGSPPSNVGWGLGGWQTRMSLISAPRNIMYS